MPRLKHSQYRFRHADLPHPHPVLCTTALEAVVPQAVAWTWRGRGRFPRIGGLCEEGRGGKKGLEGTASFLLSAGLS